MKTARIAALTTVVLTLSACNARRAGSTREVSPAPADAPPALAAAHEAYLTGDFVTMGERLRDVLVDPRAGELARDNAFELLESAYEAAHGQLPARTQLPPSVRNITFGVMNGATAYGPHRMVFLKVRVTEGRAAHVTDLRLTRLPSESILSLAEKRGTFKVSHGEKGFEDIDLDVRQVEVLPERGAFGIQLAFDDAPGVDTFVLADKMIASTQPEVTSPDVGQVFKDTHPTIAWRPYRSPEFAPWEARAVNIGITPDATNQAGYSFYKFQPGDLASVRPGDPETPPLTLAPGSFWLDLLYMEERTFGGIRLSRATNTARPFSVVP